MIRRESTRNTVEDKSKDIPEIYAEDVTFTIRVFGIKVFSSHDTYRSEEKEVKTKTMGFRK
jgi:hypothetical protein